MRNGHPAPSRSDVTKPVERDFDRLLATVEKMHHTRDLDTLLENILFEARRFLRADAGTIYLEAKGQLFFRYVQNDTLFAADTAEKRHMTASKSLPIDTKSLAGYAAYSKEPLLIDDVYDIQSNVDYSHNPAFDQQTQYRTRSMLIVPLLTSSGDVVGVLQLINAMSPGGEVVPFSGKDRLYIMQYAQYAATAIERTKLTRELVLRMVELAKLRDPFETAQHAKRVAAYASELYTLWAERTGISEVETRQTREALIPAAMLHDVGKIGVSDTILKKSTSLEVDEIGLVKMHTIHGGRLFTRLDSPWDRVAHEVALNHHEHWDGTGYPGHVEDLFADPFNFGPGKREEEIPITARIVSIADVYDALVSRRAYKEAWSNEAAREYIRTNAGSKFDPELTEIFLKMQPVIQSIRDRFDY